MQAHVALGASQDTQRPVCRPRGRGRGTSATELTPWEASQPAGRIPPSSSASPGQHPPLWSPGSAPATSPLPGALLAGPPSHPFGGLSDQAVPRRKPRMPKPASEPPPSTHDGQARPRPTLPRASHLGPGPSSSTISPTPWSQPLRQCHQPPSQLCWEEPLTPKAPPRLVLLGGWARAQKHRRRGRPSRKLIWCRLQLCVRGQAPHSPSPAQGAMAEPPMSAERSPGWSWAPSGSGPSYTTAAGGSW